MTIRSRVLRSGASVAAAALMASTLTLGAPVAATTVVASAATTPSTATTIKIGSTVAMLDSGFAISYVGVPVSITCPESQPPTQFNAFVAQPSATGSFGMVIAQCTGKAEKFVVSVQSNFGSLYQEGKATATVTDNTTSASREVKMFRLSRLVLG